MANVILENRTKRPRRMLVFNLTRNVATVKVVNRTTEETRQGERRKRVSSKLVPDSIRVPYGGGQVEVDEKVLGVPDVAAAISRRELRAIRPEAKTPSSEGNGNGPKPRRKKS